MNTTKNKPSTDPRGLPPITGVTPEQIKEAEAIRAKLIPEFDGAADRHAEMISNSFPDATPEGIAEMNSAATAGIAEIKDRWLSQTSADWWIKHRGQSPVREIDDAVKASILAAAKPANDGA